MLRQIALAAALVAFGAETARSACPGQTGKTIFADDFSDDSGGWDIDANEVYAPNALEIKTSPKLKATGALNQTFSATNADYCEIIEFSKDQPEANNLDYNGIVILANNYNNRLQMNIYSDGTATIFKFSSGNTATLMNSIKIDSINTQPGADNTLRAIVKDQKITFFVNGIQIKTIRSQTFDGANKFGFFAGAANPITKERVYAVKMFSVTEAQ